ncbi:glycosyl transferase [Aerococcus urinaehominis]|uniref:Glycosyl transferase n=1 Tax=Aerococcus urinaehominis TaxID=128944 RepID=A0A109RI30_9LACT|nr:glycosyltransferase family 2 protein [Aerococcus urinaehominis]AMB99550.1 glycosyl transferase [Aerococcus urinaehominis]SDM34772.1 teichuronic acid biosynthesis glycosyltransferase TuaG [Aerococcus urinaehominis]
MTGENYLVSIVTPVYNAAAFIGETIQSVQNQTYENWELILVNDCSPDNSRDIILTYQAQDQRIKLIDLAENGGAAVARNAGLDAARGDFIAFIDSDDVWSPTKLADQLAFMIAHNYAFSYTDLALVDVDGQIIKPSQNIPKQLTYHQLLKNTAIACSTVMIDKRVTGSFHMPLVRKGQDTATWLMLMREHDLVAYGLDKVLNYYRQVPGSVSSNRLAALKRTWHTYYRLERLPLTKAAYYFGHYVYNAMRRRL